MNQTTISNAANAAAEKSKNLVTAQIEKRVHALGATVTQTARDLENVGTELRQSGTIGGAAQVADWAARYVSAAGKYLEGGDSERFIVDIEAFGRRQPWVIAASAAALGFAAARVIKSSSARRFSNGAYVESYGDDYAFESSSVNPTSSRDTI